MKFSHDLYIYCPYCGHAHRIMVENYEDTTIVYCDSTDDGCDHSFVYHYKLETCVVDSDISELPWEREEYDWDKESDGK